jgi:hypothetical protein
VIEENSDHQQLYSWMIDWLLLSYAGSIFGVTLVLLLLSR